MTKFAYCDITNRIRQYDTATPSLLPVPIYDSTMNNVTGLALASDQGLVLCGGPYTTGHVQIDKAAGSPKIEQALYSHPDPILNVRVRSIGGADRIYFSVGANLTPQGDPQRYDIYYLKPGVGGYLPVLYTSINPADLTFLNPCTGQYDMYWYRGDFVFGDNDELYLSTGGLSGCKVGVYRIDGAGPDSVTGQVQRIHEGDGPIECLCYESPQTLYFLRRTAGSDSGPATSDIWKLDLGTNVETLAGQIPLLMGPYGTGWALDLVEVGDTLMQLAPWWWGIPSALSKALFAAARYVVRLADTWQGGRPTPHPDPRGSRDGI